MDAYAARHGHAPRLQLGSYFYQTSAITLPGVEKMKGLPISRQPLFGESLFIASHGAPQALNTFGTVKNTPSLCVNHQQGDNPLCSTSSASNL